MKPELIIRIFTIVTLGGLLLAVGLRLTFAEVAESVKRCRFGPILALNFGFVPVVCGLGARWAGLDPDSTTAMVLLGAAPFAPVVPIFARLARADIALAAGLTSLYPALSAFLTPWACGAVLRWATGTGELHFGSGEVMMLLVATITVPLALGVGLNRVAPGLSRRCLRPVEVVSEAAGACSLAYVTIVEFDAIFTMSWKALVLAVAIFELCLAAGYWLGNDTGSRRVIGLGTSNRNIALALLVALQSFPGQHVVSCVVGLGLVMILLGLAHVGYWKLWDWRHGKRV